jgi:hypothetical protein
MPRLDGTGPWGLGPRTGWSLGFCGRGRRYFSSKNELMALEEEEQMLKEELEKVRREKKALEDQKE